MFALIPSVPANARGVTTNLLFSSILLSSLELSDTQSL